MAIAEIIKRRLPYEEKYLPENLGRDERIMLAIIDDIITNTGSVVPIKDIFGESKRFNLAKKKASKLIEELKKKGEIFEPKAGFIQKI